MIIPKFPFLRCIWGMLSEHEEIAFIQSLVDTDKVWDLEPFFVTRATELIKAGRVIDTLQRIEG